MDQKSPLNEMAKTATLYVACSPLSLSSILHNISRRQQDNSSYCRNQIQYLNAKAWPIFRLLIAIACAFKGGFSAPDFNTQSGGALRLPFLDLERRSESIFGIQSAPRFQAIYGVESVPPRFQPIFGTQSAPPLSSSIWC